MGRRPDDIPAWDDLADAVDLFAKAIEDDPERGDALIFDLTTMTVGTR